MSTQPIILFDGFCNLCNSSVLYVIRHDPRAIFKFASLQSETGRTFLKQYGLATNDIDSFVLIQNNLAFTRSTAALKVARQLKGPVKILYGFIIVPPFIRNVIYDLIAAKRYHWFGKKDACMVPTPALENRFIN